MEHDTMPVLGSGDVSEHPQGFAMWVCRFFWGGISDLGIQGLGGGDQQQGYPDSVGNIQGLNL